jgi:LAS superfamily LD-carboxypeptidase LdcB
MSPLRNRLTAPVLAGGLAVAIGAGLFLSPPTSVNAFGTLGRAEAATSSPAPAPAAPGLDFPGVEGVDLMALGYRGVDLDAVTVAALDTPLPELPMERADEIRARIEVAAAHVEGLRGAEYVLYETARSQRRDVNDAVADLEAAAKVQAKAEKRLTKLQAGIDQQRVLLAQQPALDVGTGINDATLNAASLDALAAHQAQDVAELQVIERKAQRQAHRAALDVTHREANRMDAHIEYLGNELRQARAGMLAAGRWLAEEERGRKDLPIVTVEGFQVHASIAGSLHDMVLAARADGIDLRGKGYRSTSRQIELRRQNCGPTEFDIYEKSSSACSPPTAKPNRSLHESGLALDFRQGEESITSRSQPAYRWLAANAAAYGFFNLASEPWHWSVSAS